jgi:threonine synthase
VALSRAFLDGIAPDGGLYVPTTMPTIDWKTLGENATLDSIASRLLAPFFEGDALSEALPAIAAEALDFPAPLRPVGSGAERLSVLELFHGPTASFKDFGARFLAACLARIPRPDPRPLTIIVATSGDTGGAVAAAFHRRPAVHIVLLFPANGVSPLQARQLTCWGDNIQSYAVRGSFDDCQRLAKQAFRDVSLQQRLSLGSANSINIGRLLPQMTYFAAASLRIRAGGGIASFVVPSGNLGQAVACIWARELGLPIGDIVLAHNANRAVPDYFSDRRWNPKPTVQTIANAMDVGDPSNMERLRFLYRDHATMVAQLRAVSVGDEEIRESIRREYRGSGLILCPHTAVAAQAYRSLPADERRRSHWVIVATAHPAKFPEIVEPLIGQAVDTPTGLARLFARPVAHREIAANFDGFRTLLLDS